MNLPEEANRLDGYLLAVSELKADGTFFNCVYLGEGGPTKQATEVERKFRFPVGSVELTPLAGLLTPENLPKPFEDWFHNRIRPWKDEAPMDPRLASRIASELADIFGRAPEWFEVRRNSPVSPEIHLGAFWSIYIFGCEQGSCAIHCSWDD